MTDQDNLLWQSFREGDRNAFELLLKTYYRPLFDYGHKFLKDRDRLKDCVHDLFVDLWERRTFLNETPNLKLYLFSALRNQIFREKKQVAHLVDFTREKAEQELPAPSHAESSLIEEEITLENQARLQQTIRHLTKRQQEILHLKFYENLTNEQIADLLGISRPAVANLLYQTLKSFREKWNMLFMLYIYLFFSKLFFVANHC